jgi:hypothetical protein
MNCLGLAKHNSDPNSAAIVSAMAGAAHRNVRTLLPQWPPPIPLGIIRPPSSTPPIRFTGNGLGPYWSRPNSQPRPGVSYTLAAPSPFTSANFPA